MTSAAPAAGKTKQATSYRVLKFPDKAPETPPTASSGYVSTFGFKDIGTVKAANASAAIRAVAEKNGDGTYVAVPESSWKPQKVTVSQTTVVKVGDA